MRRKISPWPRSKSIDTDQRRRLFRTPRLETGRIFKIRKNETKRSTKEILFFFSLDIFQKKNKIFITLDFFSFVFSNRSEKRETFSSLLFFSSHSDRTDGSKSTRKKQRKTTRTLRSTLSKRKIRKKKEKSFFFPRKNVFLPEKFSEFERRKDRNGSFTEKLRRILRRWFERKRFSLSFVDFEEKSNVFSFSNTRRCSKLRFSCCNRSKIEFWISNRRSNSTDNTFSNTQTINSFRSPDRSGHSA